MRTRFPNRLAAFALFLFASPAFADDPAARDVPAQNLKIVEFCQANKSKKVDSGECAALAAAALKTARCRRFRPYGFEGDFVWGTLAAAVVPGKDFAGDKIRPGDIIQLRDARFPNGFVTHHTAVVVGVKDNGRSVSVLEQNTGNGTEVEKRTVKPGEYPLGSLKEGWVKVYRPVLLPPPVKETAADPIAAGVVRLLNAERKKRGSAPLTLKSSLSAAALAMARRTVGEQPVKSEDLLDAIQDAGYIEKTVSYVSVSGGSSAADVVRFWLASPAQAENLMSPAFTEIGINTGVANKQRMLVRYAICAAPAVAP